MEDVSAAGGEIVEIDELAPRRGRPTVIPGCERRGLLMEAARRVFCSVGYGPATMTDVATAAGMSKKTLYQLFPSKAALFVELVRHDRILPPDSLLDPPDDTPMETVLNNYLVALAEIVMSPPAIAMQRLVIGEATRDPELAATFHREVVQQAPHCMGGWLERQAAAGRLQIDDVEDASGILFGVALGKLHIQMLMNPETVVSPEVLRRRVARGVRVFLAGYRPAATAGG